MTCTAPPTTWQRNCGNRIPKKRREQKKLPQKYLTKDGNLSQAPALCSCWKTSVSTRSQASTPACVSSVLPHDSLDPRAGKAPWAAQITPRGQCQAVPKPRMSRDRHSRYSQCHSPQPAPHSWLCAALISLLLGQCSRTAQIPPRGWSWGGSMAEHDTRTPTHSQGPLQPCPSSPSTSMCCFHGSKVSRNRAQVLGSSGCS